MSSLWNKITGAFKRGHPDVYDALKDYAEKHGVTVADVIASASAAYLQSDAEGKEELEKKMAERRMVVSKPGTADIKETMKVVEDLLNSIGGVFNAVNNVRSSVSVQAIVTDYKTLKGAVEGVTSEGAGGGAGSLGDKLAEMFIRGLVDRTLGGGGELPTKSKLKKTGKGAGEEQEVKEEP